MIYIEVLLSGKKIYTQLFIHLVIMHFVLLPVGFVSTDFFCGLIRPTESRWTSGL